MCANQIVTGLHAFECLIHVACHIPSFYADSLVELWIIGMNLACACCPAICPLLVAAFGEVAVGNQVADVGAGSIVFGNCILLPLDDALHFCLNLSSCSGVVLDDERVRTERVVLVRLFVLCEICIESIADVTLNLVIIEEMLHFLTLSDVVLINACILFDGLLLYVYRIDGVGKCISSLGIEQRLECLLELVEEGLSSNYFVEFLLLEGLDSVGYVAELIFAGNREVLACCEDDGAVRGIGEGIHILAEVLEPVACAELFAVSLPSKSTALEVFLADDAYMFLVTVASIAVLDVVVDAAVAVACEVAFVAFCTFH